jgi:mono/diheme cytochrome c family protein
MRISMLCLVGLMLARGFAADVSEPKFTPQQVAYYENQVLPILKENCLKCHSGKKLRGGLSLESHAAMKKGGDLGPAVIAGKPEASPFLKAIQYRDGLEMPPSGKLPDEQIAILTKWVEMGLPFPAGSAGKTPAPGHEKVVVTEADRNWWSYKPLKKPDVPKVPEATGAIDAFVRQRLNQAGLSPNPEASRLALVRRVYFDLTGLPPTPLQVDAFVNDNRPDAYERLVESLLASPAYGERWGRHWLDLVRYAETHGYERDSAKPYAWRYRDYVINAFNNNKPYDKFITEQLAGDILPHSDFDSLVATGYYRLGLWDDEPADRLQAKYDVLDDIVSTTASVFLGTSLGCARCHDHKKDPLPQKDYYRLLAVFRDITDMNRENLRKFVTPEDEARLAAQVKARQAENAKLYARLFALEQKSEGAVRSDLIGLRYRFYRDAWHALPDFDAIEPLTQGEVPSERISLAAAPRTDGIGLVFEGKLRATQEGEYSFTIDSSDGARLFVDGKRVINRDGKGRKKANGTIRLTPGMHPVRLEYFNTTTQAVLEVLVTLPDGTEHSLSAKPASVVLLPDSREKPVTWKYTTEVPAPGWNRHEFIDDKWASGPGGFGRRGTPGSVVRTDWHTDTIWMRARFHVDKIPSSLSLQLHHDEDVLIYINGVRVHGAKGYTTAYQRVPLGPEAIKALRLGENVLAVHCKQTVGGQYIDMGLVAEAGSKPPQTKSLTAEERAELARLRKELARRAKEPIPTAGNEVMCVSERGKAVTQVLIRGNPHAPGEAVQAGAPEVLGSKPFDGSRRLQLAEWLADPNNPLTARVMANRIWHYHFGRGIVATTNDFGKLGEAPTHPELLDWLAAEFRDQGWDIKHLHRLILNSSTYKQSSMGRTDALKVDGGNNLLWRFNMRRLHAEEVRDAILSVSGELNRTMAGPSVFPQIPPAVLAGQSVPGSGWKTSAPVDQVRRSVYVHVKRSLLVPILQTHDSADTDSSCPVRYTTTVPTQALGMLNGEFTNEQAGKLAQRLRTESDDLSEQVRSAIRLTTGRIPNTAEVDKDVAFITRVMKEDGLPRERALALYCLLALNANEFAYVD